MKGEITLLKLIFGLPSSGKTSTILNLIKESVFKEREVVLIVPEQFSFQSEKAILHLLGDDNASKVKVMSFTRLYDELSDKIGGGCGKLLSDGDKIVLMNRTLNSVKDELLVWGKYSHSLNFSKSMLDTIGEFKINAVSVEDIKKAAEDAEKVSLKNKLHDIAVIYENFDLLLGEKYIDPVDKLTKVYRLLEDTKYFSDKTVFFDSFKAFTGQQFKIIDRILSQANDVYFAINNDVKNEKEYDLFYNIRKNIENIKDLAEKNKITLEKPIIHDTSKYTNENLSSLERLMANYPITADLNDSVSVCCCNTAFDEAEFAARNIRKLVREQNYRYKDFVIIARDTERYQQAIEYACSKNDIPCFYDKRVSLNSLPFSFTVDAAISALDLSTQNILRFHKCGFSKISTDDLAELENYTFLWNINGDMWLEEWNMDPRGFETSEMTTIEEAILRKINRLRKTAIEPILNFKNEFNGNAKHRATAIVNLLESCNAKKVLNSLCKRFEEIESDITPDILKQGYSRFMTVLDSLVNSFGDKTLSKTEFYEALTLALSIETVSAVPQFLDEVCFGSADRIQPARPKIAFVLGCNQGVFPKIVSSGGVLAQNDRKNLIKLGIKISDNAIQSAIDENYLVYSNVCCASERVFITYATTNTKGEELLRSPFVSAICENLNPKLYKEPDSNLSVDNLPETSASVFSQLCQSYNDKDTTKILVDALEDKSFYDNVLLSINKDLNSISPENAEKLFGNTIRLSATKVDTINSCRFSYFCKYGLRAQSLQPVVFNNLQRGRIVHYVLERIIDEHKDDIGDLSDDILESLTDKYINEYLNLITGFEKIRDSRFEFLIYRISRSLKDVVKHIASELKQSDFKPIACELEIDYDEGLKLEFPYDKGIIKIKGSIDRVDQCGDQIRVVDYKTGTKEFKLPDILFGLNMQMLIYLYAVVRGQGKPDENAAAILYMPANRDVKDEGLAMNGIIKSELPLVYSMEKANAGKYIPRAVTTKDNNISKISTSYLEPGAFTDIFNHIEKSFRKTGNLISSGDITVSPVNGRNSEACKYCEFKAICNVDDNAFVKVPALSNDKLLEELRKED